MIDPLERWAQFGEKPDYAGLLTYSGTVYSQDPAELAGFDVAIVGAPMDDLVSDRPGARMAPRAIRAASCPPGPHLEAKVDAFAELRVIDFGDAAVLPADPERSHAAIEATVAQVVAAGAIPVVLGGDHSITEPAVRAVADAHGPVGMRVHERVDALLAHHGRRLDATLAAVGEGRGTAHDVAGALPWTRHERRLPDMDPFNAMLAVLETQAHLDVLGDRGAVRVVSRDGIDHYTTS